MKIHRHFTFLFFTNVKVTTPWLVFINYISHSCMHLFHSSLALQVNDQQAVNIYTYIIMYFFQDVNLLHPYELFIVNLLTGYMDNSAQAELSGASCHWVELSKHHSMIRITKCSCSP